MLFSYSQKQRLKIHYMQRAQKERLGKKGSTHQTCETGQIRDLPEPQSAQERMMIPALPIS